MSASAAADTPDATELIDWDLAVAIGIRLVRPGPAVTAGEARAVVADLRGHASAARAHVRAVTGMDADPVAPSGQSTRRDLVPRAVDGGVAVIDRAGWIRANADGFRTVLEPVVDKLRARRKWAPGSVTQAVGPRLTAVETGSLLAFLAGKVLGQYELFPPYGSGPQAPHGRLLLVAPNIVAAEREMAVDPRDFRLWVCIHEETHRVQFGAVPWLRAHVIAEVHAFLEETDVDPAALLKRLGAAVEAVGEAFRSDPTTSGGSLLEAVQTPAQRAILDRLTAVMSLLEGHADVVMDAVGPDVIPTVADIRARFQIRREGSGRLDQVVRRLLGLEAKMAQYRDGARFVRAVVDRVGMAGFNRVWDSPQTLPTRAEIADPDAWVARVHPRQLGA